MQVFGSTKTVSNPGGTLHVVIGILVFGSIWGLVEATLGGALHFVHFPLYLKGAIPAGIGMAIMAIFVAMYRQPKLAFLLAVIAALFKPLSAWFKSFEGSIKLRIGAGAAVGYLSHILYAILASSLGMGKWGFMGVSERVTTALTNGTALAIVGTCLLLLGYVAGTKVRPNIWQFSDLKPKAFYASTIAITAFCWVVAAIGFWQHLW